LELTYPPHTRDLDAHGERITEPVFEDFLEAMVQESLHSFEGMKNKERGDSRHKRRIGRRSQILGGAQGAEGT
jgi:hypothetical protein